MYAQLQLSPPDPRSINSSVPEELSAVVLKALAKDPIDRFQSTRELFGAACESVEINPKNVPERFHFPQSEQLSPLIPPTPPKIRWWEQVSWMKIIISVVVVVIVFTIIANVTGIIPSPWAQATATYTKTVEVSLTTNGKNKSDGIANMPTSTATPTPTTEFAVPTATIVPLPTSTPVPTWTPTPAHQPINLETNPVDGAEIVLVPAGEYTMGSSKRLDPYFWGAEGPQHEVLLDEFWIYRYEVTNEMYQVCAEARACPRPVKNISINADEYYGNPQFADYPVIYVSHTHALSYCRWAGGSLPTEAEWEKAARGTDAYLFPWGNQDPTGTLVNLCDSRCARGVEREISIDDGYPGTAPVGSFPAGASPYGAFDMGGNVWEWTRDYFEPAYYNVSPYENPLGPASGRTRVIRGGGWNNPNSGVRTVGRASLSPDKSLDTLGFRCVLKQP